jgi:hypothetical protein
MTTRAQLRTIVRERLEDTTATPLWSEAALNEYLAGAIRAYGVRVPRRATATTAPVVTAATTTELPADVVETAIVAVRDAHGRDVPQASQHSGPVPADAMGLIQAWSVWGGTLRLQRPAGGDEVGAWAIDSLGGRELVADDLTPQPIDAGDEPIVVALAAAQALARRAVEDAKRGVRVTAVADAATRFAQEAHHLMAACGRRVRSGFVTLV